MECKMHPFKIVRESIFFIYLQAFSPKLKKNKQEREKGVKFFPLQAENELRLSQSEFDRQVKKQEAKYKDY